MNALASRSFKSRACLLTLICLSAGTALSYGQTFRINGGVTLNTVPTGTQATLNGPITTNLSELPYSVALNNSGAGRSGATGGGVVSLNANVQTGDLSNEPFLAGGASTSINVRDQLTVTGSASTGTPRIKIDFDLTGSVTVNEALYNPAVPQQSFNAIASVVFRFNSAAPRTIEYNLRDVLAAQGGPTPRMVNGTFPIARSGSILLTITPGTSFTTRMTHSALVSFDAVASEGTPPPDGETFRPVADFDGIQMQTEARITKISFQAPDFGTGSITNPVISSFSGYDYNPLQNGLPPRVLGVTRDASSFTVQWASFAGQSTFAAYATDDLTRPRAQWSKIGQNIPNTGSTNSFTESGIAGIPRRFYVIENE